MEEPATVVPSTALGHAAHAESRAAAKGIRTRRGRASGLPLLAFLLLLTAAPLSGQNAPPPGPASGPPPGPALGPEGEVGLALWLRPSLSAAGDRLFPLAGLGGALRLSPAFELGGEGVIGLGTVRISPEDSSDRSELTLGYGGVVLRHHRGGAGGHAGWSTGLLLGAGTARVRSTLVDAELGTENFLLVEPSLSFRWSAGETVGAGFSAGYRFVPGADPLPGMERGDLQGPVVSISLFAIRDP